MNGYICFHNNKHVEVYAETSYKAQQKAARLLKVKKSHEITAVLAEKDGQPVTHAPLF